MIQVEHLTKYYGAFAAVRDLNFSIEKGEVIGFLGLNGAGKTTTLRILGCVLLPTSGRVRIGGFDVESAPHEIRKRIGFLPDTPPLYEDMTVSGYLRFVARLRKVPAREAAGRVRETEEKAALRDVEGERISSLSHGYRQRLGIAQALVHNPELLILDEPTSGLDPVQTVEMRALIRQLEGSHTILVSSHILSEISQTCHRLLVIQEGEIVASGTEAELASRFGGKGGQVEIEVKGPSGPALESLRKVAGVVSAAVIRESSGTASLQVDTAADARPELVRALVAANVDVLRVDRMAPRLESIFLELTHGKEAA